FAPGRGARVVEPEAEPAEGVGHRQLRSGHLDPLRHGRERLQAARARAVRLLVEEEDGLLPEGIPGGRETALERPLIDLRVAPHPEARAAAEGSAVQEADTIGARQGL